MEINKANRQVADVLISDLKTKKPFLNFVTANTTTTGISADSVYARAKGSNRVSFPNSPDGTLTIEAQVYPFKMYALFSDGTIATDGVYGEAVTITATAAGSLTVPTPADGTIQAGSVFAYPEERFGDDNAVITGTYANGVFTSDAIQQGSTYEVGYIINRTNIKRVSFNSKKTPKDYFITMSTLDKDEEGVLTPFKQVFYKATPQRNFNLALSSDGDPATLTVTFDLLEDRHGDFVDMIEITDNEVMELSTSAIKLNIGGTSSNIDIHGAVGGVTVAIKDSSDAAYSKIHGLVSGDNDTVILYADSDAVAGTYTATLTDSKAGTPQTVTIAITVPTAG